MNELTQSLLKAISRYDMNLKGEYKRVRKLEQLSHPYVKRVTSNRMDRIVHLAVSYTHLTLPTKLEV